MPHSSRGNVAVSVELLEVARDRTPDILAGATALSLGITLSATLQVVQILAGITTIIVGCFAIRYYIRKTRDDK
jgi:hypothetical protein